MKQLLVLFVILIILTACQESAYRLQWKLDRGERLIYKTNMEIVKSKSYVDNNSALFTNLKKLGKLKGDSQIQNLEINELYKNSIDQNNAMQHFSFLELKDDDTINLQIIAKRKHNYSQAKNPFKDFIPEEEEFFSGKISPNGKIIENSPSFLQTYLVNIMFEFPSKEVKVGDSWPLDIRIYDFKKDNAINQVRLEDVFLQNEDEIAVLEYRVKSGDEEQNMFLGTIDFKGKGEFNITQGKWLHFEGSLAFSSAVLTEIKQLQKIRITEISDSTYQSLIESYLKTEKEEHLSGGFIEEKISHNKKEKTTESIVTVPSELSNSCPVVYSIQILATDEPIPLNSSEFKGIPYKIEQKQDPSQPKFKYKYLVGNVCSKSEAIKLKKKIVKAGFPGAFIVKK